MPSASWKSCQCDNRPWCHSRGVTNSSKNKGDEGEREAAALLNDLLGITTVQRALGAGRKEDVGDIYGVAQTAVQVFRGKHWAAAINEKLPEVEQQRINKRVRFASLWVRRLNNKIPWIVVMSPEQWARMHQYAMIGVKAEVKRKRALEQGE
jgi:Holliday junction resolvase